MRRGQDGQRRASVPALRRKPVGRKGIGGLPGHAGRADPVGRCSDARRQKIVSAPRREL